MDGNVSKNNSATKLQNIAFLKTIMMAVIVLYHSMLFFGGGWFTAVEPVYEANYLYQIARWMNTFHIQAFTMASGFLFYYLKTRRAETGHLAAIKKRAKRLLLPYICTSVLWVIPIAIYFFKYSAWDVFYKYGLMASPSQLWYLVMLFGVFIFFELFSKKIKMSRMSFAATFVLTTVCSAVLSKFDVNVFQLAKIAQYILYFYLGGYIYTNKDKITWKQAIIMAIGGISLYVFVTFSGLFDSGLFKAMAAFINPLISILEVGAIYYACTWFMKRRKSIKNKLYKLYEENSFGIYLFHQQIIYFTIIMLNGVVHPLLQVVLSFLISSAVSIAITMLLKKTKVTRLMFGV